jgi:hypothetical protein
MKRAPNSLWCSDRSENLRKVCKDANVAPAAAIIPVAIFQATDGFVAKDANTEVLVIDAAAMVVTPSLVLY